MISSKLQTFSRANASLCWSLSHGFTKFDKDGSVVIVPHGPFKPEIGYFSLMLKSEALKRNIVGSGDFDDKWIVMFTNDDIGCTEPYCDFNDKAEALLCAERQALSTSTDWLKYSKK